MSRSTSRRIVTRVTPEGHHPVPIALAAEDPLSIRLNEQLVATMMRTPGNDFELAVGWCLTEGMLDGAPQRISYCSANLRESTDHDVISIEAEDARPIKRLSLIGSSCGICGTEIIARLQQDLRPLEGPRAPTHELLTEIATQIEESQALFALTGGTHAAAAFTVSQPAVEVIREDIGRHNAVDKVIGALTLGQHDREDLGLWVSGRASFEIVTKAWRAGLSCVVTVGAASSLAVDIARAANITLVALTRADSALVMNASDQS